MDADRNLLFGVLALQGDLIDAGQFAEACTAWSARKGRPLADLLVEQGWLSSEDRAIVSQLLERKPKKHWGDARRGLEAATGGDAVRGAVEGVRRTIGDADVRQSLDGLPRTDNAR